MRNKQFVIKTFVDGNFSIDIKISLDEETIWLNESEIALIFECPRRTINYHLNNLIRDNNLSDSAWQESCQTASDGKQYNTKIYNLEIIELLSYKVRSKRAPNFISWVKKTIQELKQNQLIEINDSYNNLLHSNKYELVKFKDGNFEMDVNVSPVEETVWLTQKEIAKLFESTIMNINLHIKNILSSGELDNSVLKKNFITASDGKKYYINFYNLDMILSVGYRVNTKRGITFRRWASALIKRIIFERAKTNHDNLPPVIMDFKEDISFIKNNIVLLNEKLPLLYENNLEVDNALFFKKDKEKAHIMITSIFAQAKENIVVIDPYMDNTIISYLNEISNHVKWTLITSFSKKKLNEADIKRIEQYYDNVSFCYDEDIHDRFILLDNEKLFCIGSSLKDIPTGLSVIIRIYSKNIINELVDFTKNMFKNSE